MNMSLKRRIAVSFFMAMGIVLVMGFTIFYYLDSLNRQIEVITLNTNKVSLLTDEIRISSVSILKMQKKMLAGKIQPEDVDKLRSLCDGFQSQLEALSEYYQEAEVRQIITKMGTYVDSLKSILGKATIFGREGSGESAIEELADKILDTFSEFQDIQYFQNEKRDKQIKEMVAETKRYMLIILIVTFLGTMLLGLVVPGKISLPFKKINDAVRELQDCNLDVSISYHEDDEIGELAQEINKMIASFKKFDEMRGDRIVLEHRKFDALANMVKKHILVANAQGELIYLNNQMYSLLDVKSEEILHKSFENTLIPESIRESFDLAIKRRSKIENADIFVYERHAGEDDEEMKQHDPVFQGYANVIPIRGKESSEDFYLMVLSTEVFV